MQPQESAFHTTHWSVVLVARDLDDATQGREALATLCATYWYPLYAYIRRQGATPVEAEDLTQEFFYRFLEGDSLRNVARVNGKFRSFLLTCLKHFLSKQRERAHAARRGGGRAPIPLDAPESHYALEPADHASPDVLFERRWALTVLQGTLEDLRQEYAHAKKSELFEALKGFLPGCRPTIDRAELAAARNVSAGAIDVAIHRLRQRFGALLRQRVAATVCSEAEVDDELRHLMILVGNG